MPIPDYELIVTPSFQGHLVPRPGSAQDIKIAAHRYRELQLATTAEEALPD